MQLEDEQYRLLAKFVEGHRSTSPESRGAFIASQTHNQPQATFLHSRVSDLRFQGSMSDAEILADFGLLRRAAGSGGAILFSVLPRGIEVYEKNLASALNPVSAETRRNSGISVFISHSHQDAELVKALITLLRSALNLPSNQIRATSIDGFRLPGGSNTNEQLRVEVQDAKVLIGVISSSSLRSAYVTFELGARWGTGKPMVPLLAHDIGPESLAGPLQAINALSCRSSAQLHQLVEDVAAYLNIDLDRAAAYEKCVEQIVNLSAEAGIRTATHNLVQEVTSGTPIPSVPSLSEAATKILLAAASDNAGSVMRLRTAGGLRILANGSNLVTDRSPRTEAYWQGALSELTKSGFLQDRSGKGEVFELTSAGYERADSLAREMPNHTDQADS